MKTQEVTLEQARRAEKSLIGRISRLKKTRSRFMLDQKSPIADIDIFSKKINSIEEDYSDMLESVRSATVTLKI